MSDAGTMGELGCMPLWRWHGPGRAGERRTGAPIEEKRETFFRMRPFFVRATGATSLWGLRPPAGPGRRDADGDVPLDLP